MKNMVAKVLAVFFDLMLDKMLVLQIGNLERYPS